MAGPIRIKVGSRLGLHARPCAALAALAKRHDGALTLRCGGRSADARSVFDLMLLTAACGDEVEVEATGKDADRLLEGARDLLARDLDADA